MTPNQPEQVEWLIAFLAHRSLLTHRSPEDDEESEPADSLVLQLPADEPIGDQLDVQAFIRDWPQLLDNWKSKAQAKQPEAAESDLVMVTSWLTKLDETRAAISAKTANEPIRHDAADPGA